MVRLRYRTKGPKRPWNCAFRPAVYAKRQIIGKRDTKCLGGKERMKLEGTGGWFGKTVHEQLNWSSLTAERERLLLCACQSTTDDQARQAALTELWESHSKLVIAIASRYRSATIELPDLIGVGHLGLHAAIARFDTKRFDCRLATYAIGWIRWHIQDYIRRNAAPVRLPATTAHRQLTQMAARLLADARRSCHRERIDATDTELCERVGRRIGLPGDEVERSLQLMSGGSVSLNDHLTRNGTTLDLQANLPSDAASPEDDVILRLDHAKARKRIRVLVHEILGEREREVFDARWMSDGDEVIHLEALAKRFGVTRERVCQLEASAKRKIARALAQEGYGQSDADQPLVLPGSRAPRRRPAPASARHLRPSRIAAAATG
jgi:RNA polymerase sigma-32 factor